MIDSLVIFKSSPLSLHTTSANLLCSGHEVCVLLLALPFLQTKHAHVIEATAITMKIMHEAMDST